MASINEREQAEIAALASEKLGRRLKPQASALLHRPSFKDGVADAIEAFQLGGVEPAEAYVALVSNPDFPAAVSEAARRAEAVAAALPAPLARRVMRPVLVGDLGARSFALYPRLFPFSTNKLVRRVEKWAAADEICGWLGDVARATRTPIAENARVEELFRGPLQTMAREAAFSDHLRSRAMTALRRLDDAQFTPETIIQHGDFWMGNVLFAQKWGPLGLARDFAVIDWGASELDGSPFFDLIKYADSSEKAFGFMESRTRRYCAASGIPCRDVEFYVLAALARLGRSRNQFPMDRYARLTERIATLVERLQRSLA